MALNTPKIEPPLAQQEGKDPDKNLLNFLTSPLNSEISIIQKVDEEMFLPRKLNSSIVQR